MKDWKALAAAAGIPAADIDRSVAPLEALEKSFRPLAESLTPEIEPAFEFTAGGDSK